MMVQQDAVLQTANWLETVAKVLHPDLSIHDDHAIWQRDYTASHRLFGILLKPVDQAALDKAFASLEFIRMGFSYGGYESLLIPADPQLERSEGDWTDNKEGPLLRIHVGLESIEDIKGELARFLDNLQ